ncbi:histidine kinase [Planobispora rosea]|uniref:histidine kinase n=1 Tax=Planobispora rosea TaxID=35762 RepID=A0A8J3S1Q6_PLARO|nr:ATP-binding protein [Planobispora rosea]GGS82867.1 histidine kinase [Planobispora rosea]GIH84192.1 histidine kinase [Planobispora rosea]
MVGRKHSIKVKIFTLLLVPLVSLVAIWGFAATLTAQGGLDLLRAGSLYNSVVVPTRTLTTALQHERLLSLKLLGDPTSSRAALDAQRARTNTAREELDRLIEENDDGVTEQLRVRVLQVRSELDRLTAIRSGVDARSATRQQTLDAYSSIVWSIFDSFEKMYSTHEAELVDQTLAIVVMGRSRELLSRQAALISGVVAAGFIGDEDRAAFAELATGRKLLYSLGFNQLDEELRGPYASLATSVPYRTFEQIERAFATASRPDPSWATAATTLSDTFDRFGGDVSRRINERSAPLATAILTRLGVVGGLGLVAVIVSIFISVRFGRRIGTELVGLQEAALDLADRRLPDVVARLRRGEEVCTKQESESPALRNGDSTTTEIVRVGEAFSSVQRTAVEAAVGQAEMRKGVNKVFVNLARRSQTLLHRQLTMLEAMETRASDPETLDELFALDHLTTRMRRHAEGLIILSGAAPGRGWRVPVAVYDVVRAATEEVEDYLRVTVAVPQGPALVGPVVTDVIHLLAELVENAVIFSPPTTTVRVYGETVARGYAIEVEDRGLGMSAAEMNHYNARLADPPEFDLADSDRLGLFVVGRLAARHGIRVSLRPSPYGGTTAIVLIPAELIAPAPEFPVLPTVEIEQTVTGSGLPKRTRQAAPQRISQVQVAPAGPPPAQITSGETAAPPSALSGEPGGNGLPRRVRHAAGVETAVPGSVLTSFRAGWRRGEKEDGER